MTITIIGGALLHIRQHGVGFAAFLELIFRVGIVRIAVGMVLERQLAIGAFDLLIGGGVGYPQHFIVVAFSVAGQNGLSQFLSIIRSRLQVSFESSDP